MTIVAKKGRELPHQQVGYLRGTVKAVDSDGASLSGVDVQIDTAGLPNGAIILPGQSGVLPTTAFTPSVGNASQVINVGHGVYWTSDGTGTSADDDEYVTSMDVRPVGIQLFTAASATATWIVDADRRGLPITAHYSADSGAAASAGEAEVFVAYIQNR